MNDFQIADEKAILKLNEEYRNIKLQAINKISVLSKPVTVATKLELNAQEIFNIRAILKAI